MQRRPINAPDAPSTSGGYAQAVEIVAATKLLFISGQIPERADGSLPGTFLEQCRLVWANIEAQLRAADMSLDNLIKVTTYLPSRAYAAENRAVREAVLAGRAPALTVIIAGIFEEAWLIEIEAIAAA